MCALVCCKVALYFCFDLNPDQIKNLNICIKHTIIIMLIINVCHLRKINTHLLWNYIQLYITEDKLKCDFKLCDI